MRRRVMWASIGTAVVAVVGGTSAVVGNVGDLASSPVFNIASRGYVDETISGVNEKLAAQIDDAHRLLKTLGNMTADGNVASYELRLKIARQDLAKAERDLSGAPGIESLQHLVETLRFEVEELEGALTLARCYRTEIISEQPQGCRSP